MRTASEWVSGATTGNTTTIDVAADRETVWDALHGVTTADTPISGALMRIRLLPAKFKRPSSRSPGQQRGTPPLIKVMTSTRFIELYREEAVMLTMGVVGQFWKLSAGEDAKVQSPGAFSDFDTPGFVRAAIDFTLEPTGDGTRLTTSTCNRATDPRTERVFRRYWAIIGLGSKFIRWELLRAVRSRAEQR
jgi:hypothetical protein